MAFSKRFAAIMLLCLLFAPGTFAQEKRAAYQPKLFQGSIRTGLLNSELNFQYRLAPKTILSVDLGLGKVYLHSQYYNRFNKNYGEYDKHYDNVLNFGREWSSLYTAVQVRRILNTQSHIKYKTGPYTNTFIYYALQLKRNGQETRGWLGSNTAETMRETYQFAALLGRQVEINKAGNLVFDFYFGLGVFANYNLKQVEPKFVLGTRIGWNFWRVNN